MTTDNKIESFTRIEIKSASYPFFEEWAKINSIEYSPCTAPDFPRFLGAVEPRLSCDYTPLKSRFAQQIQQGLNNQADYLESRCPMSADTRNSLNRARDHIFANLCALDTALVNSNANYRDLRKQLDQASTVRIQIEDPSLLTREGQSVFDTLTALAQALDALYCLSANERDTINSHLQECSDALESMDVDLDYAESTSNTADEECEQARDEADEAKDTITAAADRFDRAPHLIDDLEDYAAHLRHTSADRKAISLMELAVSTLKTIRTLLS